MNQRTQPLLLIFLICSFNLKGQSVIYKKDGSAVTVTQLGNEGKIYSYKLLNEPSGNLYFLSANSIDSIRYENGRIAMFPTGTEKRSKRTGLQIEEPEKRKNNSVGILLPVTFSGHGTWYGAGIWYERLLLNNRLGFKNIFFAKLNKTNNEIWINQSNKAYYFSTGLNYYYVKSGLFRIGLGLFFIAGSENFELYELNYIQNTALKGLQASASLAINWLNRIHPSLEIGTPVVTNTTYKPIFLKLEIAFNF